MKSFKQYLSEAAEEAEEDEDLFAPDNTEEEQSPEPAEPEDDSTSQPEEPQEPIELDKIPFDKKIGALIKLLKEFGYYDTKFLVTDNKNLIKFSGDLSLKEKELVTRLAKDIGVKLNIELIESGDVELTEIRLDNIIHLEKFKEDIRKNLTL